jgi:hypothetical protein
VRRVPAQVGRQWRRKSLRCVIQQEDFVVGIHGTVMGPVRLDKASAEVAEEMLGQQFMTQVVARIQVADAYARLSELDGLPGSRKLGEIFRPDATRTLPGRPPYRDPHPEGWPHKS